jgi:hypothetical protein
LTAVVIGDYGQVHIGGGFHRTAITIRIYKTARGSIGIFRLAKLTPQRSEGDRVTKVFCGVSMGLPQLRHKENVISVSCEEIEVPPESHSRYQELRA